MIRVAAVGAAALALASACAVPDGNTCGRGRCFRDQRCVSVFGDGRINHGSQESAFPNVDNEWWCAGACPAGMGCAAECLQNPVSAGDVVCAADSIEMVFRSSGRSCLCDPGATEPSCTEGQRVDGFDLADTCAPAGHTVLSSCAVGVDCSAGTFFADDPVPAIRLFSSEGNELLYCPGAPANRFGMLLPAGKALRVYVDRATCD